MVKVEHMIVLVLGLSFFACDCVGRACDTGSHDGYCMYGVCVSDPEHPTGQQFCMADDLEVGESCYSVIQCEGWEHHDNDIDCLSLDEFEPNGPLECMQLKAQGDKCGYGERCMYGLACIDSVCVPKQPEGARCYVSWHRRDCESGLICMPDNPNLIPLPKDEVYKKGVCAPTRREGQTCQLGTSVWCEDSLKCEDGRCIKPPPPEPPEPVRLGRGARCEGHQNCERGLVCYQGRCAQVFGCLNVARKPMGLERTGCWIRNRDVGLYTDLECDADQVCAHGYCILGVCHEQPPCAEDGACPDGAACWEEAICLE